MAHNRRDLIPFAEDYAESIGLDRSLGYGLFEQETNWRDVPSDDGEGYGLGQMSYTTAAERGVDLYTPESNIKGSLDYLKELQDKNGGDIVAALSQYNQGENSGAMTSNYAYSVLSKSQSNDTAYATPSDELGLDLSHPLEMQDGIEDTGLAHTDKAMVQKLTSLNAWAVQNLGSGLVVSGGWRSPENNAAVGGVSNSDHLSGRAIDLDVSNYSQEQLELLEDQMHNQGFSTLYHDAGTGMHLHVGIENPELFQYMAQSSDYLPEYQPNTGWFGDGAVASPWSMTKDELLGSYSMDSSPFWQTVQKPDAWDAFKHGWTSGRNLITNAAEQFYVNAIYSDGVFSPEQEQWKPDKVVIDEATQQLYGNKDEVNRIASMSSNADQFAYYLKESQKFYDEEMKYRDYYSGLGVHTLGTLGAAIADPLNFIPYAGIAAKGAKVLQAAKAMEVAEKIGATIRNVDKIRKVSEVAATLAKNKKTLDAIATTRNLTEFVGAKSGLIKSFGKAGAEGAVANVAQDYLVSKLTHDDTHMEQAALMGAIAGTVLHGIGRTASYLMNKRTNTTYLNATQEMRGAAERIEDGTLREAAGLQNQYKVRVENVIENMGRSHDTSYFGNFGKAVQEIADNNKVFAVSSEDAKKLASDSGFQLPAEARAWHEPSLKSTFIIKDSIKDEKELLGVLQHEIGVHQNLKDTMGDANYGRLMSQINIGRGNPGSVWAQAAKNVDSMDPAEVLGYAIEHNMLNRHESRNLLKGIKQGMSKLGMGERQSMSNQDILDFVQTSLLNKRAEDMGVSLHLNEDGSTTINGIKFSKENMGNPNALLDTIDMNNTTFNQRPSGKLNRVLDALDGRGEFVGKLTATNFGQVYNHPSPSFRKVAGEIFHDEQGRGLAKQGQVALPTIEDMSSWFSSQLDTYKVNYGSYRNEWMRETYGAMAPYNPSKASSKRIPFDMAVTARFNRDFAGIEAKYVDDALLNNPYVVKAATELKAYRDRMLTEGKKSAKRYGLIDADANMIEKDWTPVDDEWFRSVDGDAYNWLMTHAGTEGDEGVRKVLKDYAIRAADRDKVSAGIIRDRKLAAIRNPEAELPTGAPTAEEIEKAIAEGADGFVENIMKDRGERAFDKVSSGEVGDLSFFKRRLPMDTSLELQMPDGTTFSFDKNLRSYDIDYIMGKTTRRFSGEAATKNFLANQEMTFKEFSDKVIKDLDNLEGHSYAAGHKQDYIEQFEDTFKLLRGMASKKDSYGIGGALLKTLKNLTYQRFGSMMGINQLEDLAAGVAYNGWSSLSTITRSTIKKFSDVKWGKENMEEIHNLSMLLDATELSKKIFSNDFTDNITRQMIAQNGSGVRGAVANISDFTKNLARNTSSFNKLPNLTENQMRFAHYQAIADSAQWAYGRKFSALRNPFSKNKLKELGVSSSKLLELKEDIQKYLGWNGSKADSFSSAKIDQWIAERPETFNIYQMMIKNQVYRAVISDSVGNANVKMQNSILASNLLMFKGFSFRANNARFARALRTQDLDDALAFSYSLMLSGLMYGGRQAAKIGALVALGQTEQARYVRDNYLNNKAIARAAFIRTAFLSPISVSNDVYEAVTGAPTVRTTVDTQNRTQYPQNLGDYLGNFAASSPIVNTANSMFVQPIDSAKALIDKRGSKRDVTKIFNALPIPNIVGLSQAVDTFVKLNLANKLPERRPPKTKASSTLDKLLGGDN